jgi:hypothetical protein
MLDVGAWWIIARHDLSRHRACWTLARGGSLHVTIYRVIAHAGRWRVVDHCTSRFIASSRMLDVGAVHQYAFHIECARRVLFKSKRTLDHDAPTSSMR